jgi:hypothetical protein
MIDNRPNDHAQRDSYLRYLPAAIALEIEDNHGSRAAAGSPRSWLAWPEKPRQHPECRYVLTLPDGSLETPACRSGAGLWQRLIGTTAAKHAKALAVEKQRELRALVQTNPVHKAALRRSIHSMPEDSVGREVLASYLQPVRITNERF